MLIIILILLAISICLGVSFIKASRQYNNYVHQCIEADKETEIENIKLSKQNENLILQKQQIEADIVKTASYLTDLQLKAEKIGDDYYKSQIALENEKIANQKQVLQQQLQKAENDYQQEYLNILSECSEDFVNIIQEHRNTINDLKQQLTEYQSKVNAAVAEAKRQAEKQLNKDFYRICVKGADLREIELLREVALRLRDPEPIDKVIWKVFYEKPLSDMIGRVVGSGVHCGIYKITNLTNQMCYVGQAVNIADRWKQHVKRGIGAEAPTHNKLYPAMKEFGVHNFSFEIIEECDRSMLNSREDYWQEFYKAKEFGYSIK